jgi:hypothetical protein
VSILGAMQKSDASLFYVPGNAKPLLRVCAIDPLELKEIREFLKNVYKAKEALKHQDSST